MRLNSFGLAVLCLPRILVAASGAQAPAGGDSSGSAGTTPNRASETPGPARVTSAAPVDDKYLLDETVDRGVVYLFGHRMDPPYRISVIGDTLWVNGIQASPAPGAGPKRLPPEVLARRFAILREISREVELRGDRAQEYELRPFLARLAASHRENVDRFLIEGGRLVVYWRGSPAPEAFPLSGRTALLPLEPVSPLWVRVTLVKQAEGFVAALAKGGAVFVGRGVYSGPLDAVEPDLSLLRSLDLSTLAEKWSGRTLPREVALDLLDPFPLERLARRSR